MTRIRLALLVGVVLAIVLPAAPASAARAKSCEGIGKTITNLRSKGWSCGDARTLSAKWADTATPRGRVVTIDGMRCVRSDPPGPGRAVRCAKRKGAVVVSFRVHLR